MTHDLRVIAMTVVGVLLLGGCSFGGSSPTGSAEDDGPDAPARPARYVALGDSYTAAPFVPSSLEAQGCFRSTANYPSLVAAALGAQEFVDVSCSGADTRDMEGRQTTATGKEVEPQLDALTPATDLVTIGIGGNDFDVFATLTTRCPQVADTDPEGAPCRTEMRRDGKDVLLSAIDRTQKRVRDVVEQVRERSPQARVLLVSYPQVTPEDDDCGAVKLAVGDKAYAREVAERLDGALRAAAEKSDADLVDLWTASEGHDVCSDDPWVNGPETDFSRALSFHPFASGQRAAADLVLATLGD